MQQLMLTMREMFSALKLKAEIAVNSENSVLNPPTSMLWWGDCVASVCLLLNLVLSELGESMSGLTGS